MYFFPEPHGHTSLRPVAASRSRAFATSASRGAGSGASVFGADLGAASAFGAGPGASVFGAGLGAASAFGAEAGAASTFEAASGAAIVFLFLPGFAFSLAFAMVGPCWGRHLTVKIAVEIMRSAGISTGRVGRWVGGPASVGPIWATVRAGTGQGEGGDP